MGTLSPAPGSAAARVVVAISHVAPPETNPGATRLAAMVRHLPAHGWLPVVVAGRVAGRGSVGGRPTARPSEPLRLYHRLAGVRAEAVGEAPVAGPGRLARALTDLCVPDLHAGWAPGAALAAARLARRHGASAILSSSPPESSHLGGLGAALLTRLPWVAELRDGWLVEGLKGLEQHPLRRRLEALLERTTASRAGLVGVTRPIAADLERRFGAARWIPNGFDDEQVGPEQLLRARELLDPSALNLVYTGAFAISRRTQSPATLITAMRLLADDPPDGRPVALTVMGTLTEEEAVLLSGAPGCRVLPRGSRSLALALQREADGLIVTTARGEGSVATGKLFEYLGASRPILALAEGSEAGRLVGELNAGAVTAPDDPRAAADAIRRLARGELPAPDLDSPAVRAYHRRELAGRMAEALDAAVAAGRR